MCGMLVLIYFSLASFHFETLFLYRLQANIPRVHNSIPSPLRAYSII